MGGYSTCVGPGRAKHSTTGRWLRPARIGALAALFGGVLTASAAVPGAPAYASNPFPACAAPPSPGTSISVTVGTVACQELT
ncbi:MAG: hypothetical protein ACYDD6_08705, partial [Acidimicrobiales bacterium]